MPIENDFLKIDNVAEFGAFLEGEGLARFRVELDEYYTKILAGKDTVPTSSLHSMIMSLAGKVFQWLGHAYANKRFEEMGITPSKFREYIKALAAGRKPTFTGPGKALNSVIRSMPGAFPFSFLGKLDQGRPSPEKGKDIEEIKARMKEDLSRAIRSVLPPGVEFKIIDAEEK